MKIIKNIVVIILPLALLAASFVFMFSCGFGGSRFDCRVMLPVSMAGGLIAIACAAALSIPALVPRLGIWSKRLGIAYSLALCIPIILGFAYFPQSKETKLRSFEGITLQSCAQNRASVPWGNLPEHADQCYAEIGACERIDDAGAKLICYQRRDPAAQSRDCTSIGDAAPRFWCEVDAASQKKDISFCARTADVARYFGGKNVYAARAACAMRVMGAFDQIRAITAHGASAQDMKLGCSSLDNATSDACLMDMASGIAGEAIDACDGIRDGWMRSNCRSMIELP